jgi:diguanylate cyclase (GGDEF)-like protein
MPNSLPCEQTRIHELYKTGILDSEKCPAFDALAEHARSVFHVDFCIISLVDKERVWFKAHAGTSLEEVPRQGSFCDTAIRSNEVFCVEDTHLCEPFQDNQLVTAPPHVRFYAASPLIGNQGVAYGNFCLLHTKPRTLSEDEAVLLKNFALIAVALIHGHCLKMEAADLVQKTQIQNQAIEQQTRELQIRDRNFRHIETMAAVGGWTLDLEKNLCHWSNEVYRIYDLPAGAPVELDKALLVYQEPYRSLLVHMIENTIATQESFDGEFEIITAAGRRKWVRAIGEVEYVEGKPSRLFGTFQDISERYINEQTLWQAANHDAQTGLANRRRLGNVLTEAFAKADQKPGLLILDADHLKQINDTLGHAAGDALILTIAKRLTSAVLGYGIVARPGGDEFAIFLPGPVALKDVTEMADHILKIMEEPFEHEGHVLIPQVSIGGAAWTPHCTPESLQQDADLALYHAKETQRGSYVAFSSQLRKAVSKRLAVIQKVDTALQNKTLHAWYQPIVSLSTGTVKAFEALARIHLANDEILAASTFVLGMEEKKNATRLTQRMVECLLENAKDWQKSYGHITCIALNLSSIDFYTLNTARWIIQKFNEAHIPLSRLIVEVCEKVIFEKKGSLIHQIIQELRDHGATIALDDFGKGHASLMHLVNLPVHILKIDRDFIKGLHTTPHHNAIVKGLVNMAHHMGIKVVAEGIETDAQLDFLMQIGCDMGQGHLFAKPLPAKEAGQFLNAFRSQATLTHPHFEKSNPLKIKRV